MGELAPQSKTDGSITRRALDVVLCFACSFAFGTIAGTIDTLVPHAYFWNDPWIFGIRRWSDAIAFSVEGAWGSAFWIALLVTLAACPGILGGLPAPPLRARLRYRPVIARTPIRWRAPETILTLLCGALALIYFLHVNPWIIYMIMGDRPCGCVWGPPRVAASLWSCWILAWVLERQAVGERSGRAAVIVLSIVIVLWAPPMPYLIE